MEMVFVVSIKTKQGTFQTPFAGNVGINQLSQNRMRTHRSLLLALLLLAPVSAINAQDQQWKTFGTLYDGRNDFEAVAINDYQAVIIGGYARSTPVLGGAPMRTCELIDLRERRVFPYPPLLRSRAEFVALATADTTIIVLGGVTDDLAITNTVEIYDRTTSSWKNLGTMKMARKGMTARFINDTAILIVGGMTGNDVATATVEIFNTVSGVSRYVAPFPSTVNQATSINADSGRVLVFGGRTAGDPSEHLKDIRQYDTGKNTWTKVGELSEDVTVPGVIRLWNRKLLIAGGVNRELFPSRHVLLQNGNAYTKIGEMNEPRGWHGLAQWDSTRALAIAGIGTYDTARSTTNWINLKTNQITTGPRLKSSRAHFQTIAFPIRDTSGAVTGARILAIAGHDSIIRNIASVEILEPACNPVVVPSGALSFCQGDSVEFDAGGGYRSYRWSTGDTTRYLLIRTSGSYTVTTTDSSGCTATSSPVSVTVSSKPKPTITATRIHLCSGDSAILDAGPYATYLWSTGQRTRLITVKVDGVYTVTVTSPGGCAGTSSPVEITTYAPVPPPEIQRNGDTLIVTSYQSYKWYRNDTLIPGAIGQRYRATVAGSYTVKVTDSNGCSASSEPFVVIVAGVESTIGQPGLSLRSTDGDHGYVVEGNLAHEVEVYLEMIDIQGRVVRNEVVTLSGRFSHQVSMDQLPAGHYLLRVRIGDTVQVLRLVKN
jgi:hypothetical protein